MGTRPKGRSICDRREKSCQLCFLGVQKNIQPSCALDVELEFDDVVGLHDVSFAFGAELAGLFYG